MEWKQFTIPKRGMNIWRITNLDHSDLFKLWGEREKELDKKEQLVRGREQNSTAERKLWDGILRTKRKREILWEDCQGIRRNADADGPQRRTPEKHQEGLQTQLPRE